MYGISPGVAGSQGVGPLSYDGTVKIELRALLRCCIAVTEQPTASGYSQ